jgi:hypothetical protein
MIFQTWGLSMFRFIWFAKCCHKLFQIQTLSWDWPFNSRKSKQFNLVSKAQENMIMVYYTLKLRSFSFFYWTIGDWSADRLYLATTTCILPKTLDEFSWFPVYTNRTASCYTYIDNCSQRSSKLWWLFMATFCKSKEPILHREPPCLYYRSH